MAEAPKAGNGNGRPAAPVEPPKSDTPKLDTPKSEKLNDQRPIEQADTPVADPLRPKPNMKPEEALNASPNHLLEPDPLPPLNRPIFAMPHIAALHTVPLHPQRVAPHVEAAVEELRTRLGELREFLKRFAPDIGGELGELVDHLRSTLGVARHDPVRDADRRTEDAQIAARRREEDMAGPPSAERLNRRAEEDAGLAALRRIQDTSP
jgi:hypothetical protein